MITYLVLLAVIVVLGIRPTKNESEYLEKEQTNSIKGIFILIVFLNHARGYFEPLSDNIPNFIYNMFFHLIGQMMVVMFLFYSGYGICCQFTNKGGAYQSTFLRKRITLTWIHFVIAIVLYAVIAVIFHEKYSINEWVLCWTGWESIGNSNWFVFDILVLYLITYIAMIMSLRSKSESKTEKAYIFLIVILIGVFFLWAALYVTKGPLRYWYNTLLAFPFGAGYYFHKHMIEKYLSNNNRWLISLLSSIFLFVMLCFIRNSIGENCASIFFATIVLLITNKVHISNKLSQWLGIHLFSIFILQRIPMNILTKMNINPILFTAISFLITIGLAFPFDYVCRRIDRLFTPVIM